jgi:serine/threonine-protein kinase PknG
MRCARAGCSGSIGDDGYCDECWMAPAREEPVKPKPDVPSEPGALDAPSSEADAHQPASDGTSPPEARPPTQPVRRSRVRRMGDGLVEMPPVEVRDPESALMVEPSVPEGRRHCAKCKEPVGRSVGDDPGRVEGFCRSCGHPFSFRPPLSRGDRVAGQYEVAGCLDYGGLGWIYLARDRRVADRWVVLKGLVDRDDPDAETVAIAERRFLAEVEHPNIVKIHNFVEHGGEGYTVMEFVPGMSLRKVLERRRDAHGGEPDPLPVAVAIAYIVDILPALGHLHDIGLLYCDFKPDNVIDTGSSVKLIDLGGVYRMGDTTDPWGTTGFHAPEIAHTGPTVASDLYTVGRTLVVLCTDFRGYRGTHLYSLPAAEDVEAFRSHDGLYRILSRATAPDPADRFESAETMRAQLLGVLREIVAAQRGSTITSVSTVFTGEGRGPVTQPVWKRLPVPLIRADDPAAALIVSTGASDPQVLADALQALPEQTTEVRLSLARALLQVGRVAAAVDVLDELEAAHAHDGRPRDWRIDWYRGMAALASDAAVEAVDHLHEVYAALPGELAPKLALGQAKEIAGHPGAASRWYALVARTDDGYPSAAFGMARCCAAKGDHAGELAAYRLVPERSSAYVDAQIAQVMAALGADEATLDMTSMQTAAAVVEGLPTERHERAPLAARVLEACLALVRRGVSTDPSTSVMGIPFDERSIRLELEATYRSLARHAASSEQRIALVDLANQVRPRSWR